jgi:hypothetical protein
MEDLGEDLEEDQRQQTSQVCNNNEYKVHGVQ